MDMPEGADSTAVYQGHYSKGNSSSSDNLKEAAGLERRSSSNRSLYHGKLADHEIETELEAGTDAMPLPSTSPESNGPQKYEGAYKGPSKRSSFTSHCATEASAPMQYRGRLSSF